MVLSSPTQVAYFPSMQSHNQGPGADIPRLQGPDDAQPPPSQGEEGTKVNGPFTVPFPFALPDTGNEKNKNPSVNTNLHNNGDLSIPKQPEAISSAPNSATGSAGPSSSSDMDAEFSTPNSVESAQNQFNNQPDQTNTAPNLTTPNAVAAKDEATEASKETVPKSHHRPSTVASKRPAVVAAAGLDSEVLVGTRVSEGHGNFVTAYNMLTGIRVAVSRCTAKVNRPLTQADFLATEEISFDMSGGGHSPSSKYMFYFKDYAPWVFRHLRDAFRLDPVDYLMSLTAKYIVSELGSPGKSGSFFYYSRDYRFIIKTIHHSEHKLLRRILRRYYDHVCTNSDTLISQFYGLHRVRLPFGRKIHFVVMNNVFPALYEIHERYDLKGSLLGREYNLGSHKPIVVYKDLDWLRNHQRIVLGPEKRERMITQLERDVKFLKAVNVMDYSLLIGIHDMSKGNSALKSLFQLDQFGPGDKDQTDKQTNKKKANNSLHKEFAELQTQLMKATPEKLKEFDFADEYRSEFYFYHDHGGFQSTDDRNENLDVIYYVGVIDFLTGYTFRKSVETFCKSLIHDRKELSAVPSNEYGDRFLKFLRGSIGPVIPSSKPVKRTTDDKKATGTPVTAVTADTKGETTAKPATPPMPSRRPSVVGYGQDVQKAQ